MFDGKLVANEQVGVLLPIVQAHHNRVGMYFLQRTTKQKGFPYVGRFVLSVRIEIHYIATTEVGQEVFALFWHSEGDAVVAAIRCALFFVRNG